MHRLNTFLSADNCASLVIELPYNKIIEILHYDE